MKKICVIGAGPSGLICIHHLQSVCHVTCYEQSSSVGGTWLICGDEKAHVDANKQPNYKRAAYEAMKTNTSKFSTRFYDMELPAEAQNYPNQIIPRKFIAQYLEDFCLNYKLKDCIEFNTLVSSVHYESNKWLVQTQNQSNVNLTKTEEFDFVIVCNGHYWKPFIPNIENMEMFTGTVMHSVDFRHEQVFDGKNVILVGMGTSGSDISELIEARNKAKSLYKVTRQYERFKNWNSNKKNENANKQFVIDRIMVMLRKAYTCFTSNSHTL